MNIKHLEHLLALADSGSFSRAAARCFMTQSALSRSIQNLEAELGGQLLDRIGKRNELTPLGCEVVARARRIVLEASEIKRSAELLQGGGGQIRVGLGSGPGALLSTPLLCHAAEQHPDLHVAITRGPTELQLLQLRARQLDALVVDAYSVPPAPDLHLTSLGYLPGGFVCRAGHPLLQLPRVSISDVLHYPVACIPLSDEIVRLLVAQYGSAADPQRMVTLQGEEVASLIATVERSLAVYLGILAAAREGLQAGRLVQLHLQPPLQAQAHFAYITLQGRTEAPALAWFRGFVAQVLATA
ncbi:MAG TPA: LysR family transcriptional regulator [Comamonadaceae bacterium]|nr:LysR family transcriptional regulator [Comamonadaceae bacterium]